MNTFSIYPVGSQSQGNSGDAGLLKGLCILAKMIAHDILLKHASYLEAEDPNQNTADQSVEGNEDLS